MPEEHHVYPNQTYDVTRQANAERLAQSHQATIRATDGFRLHTR